MENGIGIEEAKQTDWWKSLSEIYLNLGGGTYRHGVKHYDNYISVNHPTNYQNMKVDLETGDLIVNEITEQDTWPCHWRQLIPYNVLHDITKPFPLDDNSVDRILASQVFEHIESCYWTPILTELYRILKPGGLLRIDVPDYRNPKYNGVEIELGFDPENDWHLVITTYELMKRYTDNCPFEIVEYKHYWDGDKFIKNEIDYSLGWVSRTPDNDKRDSPFAQSLVVDFIKVLE